MSGVNWDSVWADAQAAAAKAAAACVPQPMIVGDAIGLSDQIDYSKPTYYVAGGVCGFASINVKGNTSFGRWAKKVGIGRKAYYGGIDISSYKIHDVGGQLSQSLAIKQAICGAAADVLRQNGVDVHVDSRMD